MLIYIGIAIFIIGAVLRAVVSVAWYRELKRRVMTPLQQRLLAGRFKSRRKLGLALEAIGIVVTIIPMIGEML